MPPCPCCGEPITPNDLALMTTVLHEDPLEPIFHRLARPFRFSKDDGKLVDRSPDRAHRRRW